MERGQRAAGKGDAALAATIGEVVSVEHEFNVVGAN
jgi:hypothetical protein